MNLVPLESEPLYIGFYSLNEHGFFLGRVSVVKEKIAHSVIFFRRTEVKAKRLCMPHVQIPVGFGRETCLYARVALGDGLLNDLFEKVRGFLLGIGVVGCDCHSRYIFHKITTFFRLCVYFLGR